MSSSLSRSIVALAIGLVLSGAVPSAQTRVPQRTSGGLFGGDDAGRRVRQKIDFTLSVVEANDSDTPAELRGIASPDTVLGGYSTMLLGSAAYHWEGKSVQVGATGQSVVRRYSALDGASNSTHSAGVGVSARLDSRTTLFANQNIAYAPSYLYGLFPGQRVDEPGQAVAPAADYTVDDSASYLYGTTVSLSRGLSRRSRMSVAGEYRITNFLHEDEQRRDVDTGSVRADLATNLTRNLSVRLGYRYRTGTFGYVGVRPGVSASDATSEHGIETGLEYTRPLSATRRLVLGAGFGSSSLSGSPLTAQAGRVFRFAGDVAATWELTRSWDARLTARRGLEYVAQLSEPVFIDGVNAEIEGFLTSRLDLLTGARYSTGASALTTGAFTFDTYGADVRLRYGLSRTLAVYGQYLYYFYDFTQNASLPTGVPRGLERSGFRAGVTVWVPALRR